MKKAVKRKVGEGKAAAPSPSRLIDAKIKELGDWRGETLARIRALIRRSGPPGEPAGPPVPQPDNDSEPNWKFDPLRRSLNAPDGTPVPLTTAECDLLIELVSKEGLPQTRDDLCRRVFNREWSPYDRSLDGIIVKLRRKLEPNPDNPLVIKTVRGRGYVFTGFLR